MRKAIPSPNLTAVLAVAALADLLLYRLASHVFLPSQPAWGMARVLSDLGLFMSNLGGVLGVVLVAVEGAPLAIRKSEMIGCTTAFLSIVLRGQPSANRARPVPLVGSGKTVFPVLMRGTHQQW